MGANSYIDKLRAKIDKLSIELAHWRMLAQNRSGFIIINEVDIDSRVVEEHIIKEEDVRRLWKSIKEKQKTIDNLRTSPNINDFYECANWLLSEYNWTSSEQTKKEFIQELEEKVRNL